MTKVFIVDTGPIVALLNRREKHHEWAREQFKIADVLLTLWFSVLVPVASEHASPLRCFVCLRCLWSACGIEVSNPLSLRPLCLAWCEIPAIIVRDVVAEQRTGGARGIRTLTKH